MTEPDGIPCTYPYVSLSLRPSRRDSSVRRMCFLPWAEPCRTCLPFIVSSSIDRRHRWRRDERRLVAASIFLTGQQGFFSREEVTKINPRRLGLSSRLKLIILRGHANCQDASGTSIHCVYRPLELLSFIFHLSTSRSLTFSLIQSMLIYSLQVQLAPEP